MFRALKNLNVYEKHLKNEILACKSVKKSIKIFINEKIKFTNNALKILQILPLNFVEFQENFDILVLNKFTSNAEIFKALIIDAKIVNFFWLEKINKEWEY